MPYIKSATYLHYHNLMRGVGVYSFPPHPQPQALGKEWESSDSSPKPLCHLFKAQYSWWCLPYQPLWRRCESSGKVTRGACKVLRALMQPSQIPVSSLPHQGELVLGVPDFVQFCLDVQTLGTEPLCKWHAHCVMCVCVHTAHVFRLHKAHNAHITLYLKHAQICVRDKIQIIA